MNTVASTQNGRIDGFAWLEAELGFDHVLGRMDGVDFFAYSLWHHRQTAHFEDVDVDAHSDVYLQCAGSAETLVVELRERTGDGYEHWVLASGLVTGDKDRVITLAGDSTVEVHQAEVFTSELAGPIFEDYYRDGTVSGSIPRRKI